MHGIVFALTLLACLGCALAAGTFFAFSAFVMKGLARLPATRGITAMRAINGAVGPWLVAELFTTAAVCVALIVRSIVEWDQAYAVPLIVGGALYLVGAIGLTTAYHVPCNEALDRLRLDDAGATDHWNHYVVTWTRANHLRAASALGATALFAIALTVD